MTTPEPQPDPDWLFKTDADRSAEAGTTDEPEAHQHAEFAEAAESLRSAAEYMRDMAAPPVRQKERQWSLDWFFNWLRYQPNGRAFKYAVWSVGPAWMLFLMSQRFDILTAVGITFLGFVIIGGWHLHAERTTTRILTWGLPLGLLYYAPVVVVFGLAKILVGGK
ncbi:hypothetical protein ACFY0R_39740 [Streptomyces sp. NPDC001633]|uniref:hypothetical protein n=1 Tax=Streptomyces sp. NPDC001633 TaxID=3364595 RepID=UPI0036A33355